jgi:hypothetical protein
MTCRPTVEIGSHGTGVPRQRGIPLRGLKDQEYLDFVTCYELLIDLLVTVSVIGLSVQRDARAFRSYGR